MRYVVLGGSGFIGSSIKEMLSALPGSECISLSSDQCDLRDSLDTARVLTPLMCGAMVVYAAGIPRLRSDTLATMIDNITMIHNVVAVLRQARPRLVVFLSSVEVYGIPEKLPITEQTAINPETLYGIGKVAAELMLRRWHRDVRIPLAVLRLPGVYGPGDRGRGLIGALVRAVREGREFKLIGEGIEQRDFIFVEDVAKAVAALAEVEFDELTLNLATGTGYTVAEIAKRVFVIYGECPLQPVPQVNRTCHLRFDVSFLRKTLPQLTMTPLTEGLERYRLGPGHFIET